MLPRSQSIFHLGEEEGGHGQHGHGKNLGVREDGVVGLLILVRQHHRHVSNIVFKQTVSPAPRSPRHARGGDYHPCFLKACFLCNNELRPNMNVYMYRGDQGFCSEECRLQQILMDEAKEHEAIVKKELRSGLSHPRRPRSPVQGGPGRLLAVA